MIRGGIFSAMFVIFSTLVLWTIAGAFDAAQQRQVTYQYIASALTPTVERTELVGWNEAEISLARPFTPFDAELLGRALGEAWKVFAVAQETDNNALLADRFTGVAETRALQAVGDAAQYGGRQIVLSQTATPKFFHKDGSLFQADVEMIVARYLSDNDQDLNVYTISQETGVATLMNESNGWRLFSYERRSSTELGAKSAAWSGTLNGLNYYPTKTPWRDFWSEFDADITADDFDMVAGLGGNAVRVFLTRADFLGPNYPEALENLETLLSVAQKKDIQVVPTLFDLKQDFGLGTWADDAIYLKRVLEVLSSSQAVAFVDLKNEPDLDFEYHGTAKVTAWLKTIEAMTRRFSPDLPLTIGWSAAEHASLLIEQLDVVTYHDYAPLEGATDRLAEVKSIAGAKSVLITEIGDTTFEATLGFPSSVDKQANRLSRRLDALQNSDGAFIWTLYDFAEVDPTVVGSSPWVKRLQASFGVFQSDGTEKPSANVIREHFLIQP